MKLRYPHTSTVNTSSTTDDEQFTYNAVGSITSHRKRSGETITLAYHYDAAANPVGLTCFIFRFLKRPLPGRVALL